MKHAGLSYVGALLLALVLGCASLPARALRPGDISTPLSTRTDRKPAWLCTGHSSADPGTACSGKTVGGRCVPLKRCTDGSLRDQLRRCNEHNETCIPSIVYRRLDRLGCSFDPDAFWVAPNARATTIQRSEDGLRVSLAWNTKSCRQADLSQIEEELNHEKPRGSVMSRRAAYQKLLAYGCNVDPPETGDDPGYTEVRLSRNEAESAGPDRITPQPPVKIVFVGVVPPPKFCKTDATVSCVPNVAGPFEGEVPICSALETLHGAKRSALCVPASDRNMRLRYIGGEVEGQAFTQGVEIIAPKQPDHAGTYGFILPPGTLDGWARLPWGDRLGVDIVTVDGTPAATPPGISGAAAAGSVGLGAVLTALARWLFSLMKKRTASGAVLPAELATHEAHDVQVTVSFPSAPRVRTRRIRTDPDK